LTGDDRSHLPDCLRIFQHGGFGKPHALGIVTLILLGMAYVAGYTRLYGWASP